MSLFTEKNQNEEEAVNLKFLMTPQEQEELNRCVQRIAQILHKDAQAKGLPLTTLADIEASVRHQVQTQVSPQLGIFLSTKPVRPRGMNIDAP